MKILVLNGSPRRTGNTHAVLKMMADFLGKNNDVEILDLALMKLSGCMACDGCKKNGGHCVCPDESDAVIQKVAQADAVIFGTPVYWWGMSAQLKMVVDKFYSHDPQFKSTPKNIGVVVVGANSLEDTQYHLIHEQFRCIADHLKWKLKFYLPLSAYEPGEVLKQSDLQERAESACCALEK